MKKEQELVNCIDPDLNFVRDYKPCSNIKTYLVEKKGSLYVLKYAPFRSPSITREMEALQRARGIEGIPELVQAYKIDRATAILRQNIEGDEVCYKRLRNHGLVKKLEKTIHDMHEAGIAHHDLFPFNIIVSPDEKSAHVIDFGIAIFQKEPSFEEAKERDIGDLEVMKRIYFI